MRSETSKSYFERMNVVLRYIQEHLDDDLRPKVVAGVANFSPSHFHRVFKGMLGESLKAHIRRLRLERSALQLEMTERSVTDIGLDAGFETPETFSRAFSRMFSTPPSFYRVEKRVSRWAHAPSSVHYLSEEARSDLTLSPRKNEMKYDIATKEKLRVAYIRHTGPYELCHSAWGKLCGWSGAKNLITPESSFYSLCHDDPKVTPPEKIRMDVCITVPSDVEPEGEVGIMDIFGGDYATTLHTGPYDGLAATYETLFGRALPESGREYAEGPSVEHYVNNPDTTPPEELLTEIHIPLK